MSLAEFVAIHHIAEADHARLGPLRFAIVIAQAPQGVVLVFNRYRAVWELPGGFIDDGETPRAAAERELLEEAGCTARDLTWVCVTEVDDGQRHLGAVFRCTIAEPPALIDNDEIGGVAFYTRDAHPHPLGNTDAALLTRAIPGAGTIAP